MNPSSLPVLGVESEKVRGYFTILTLSIYICQKKMGQMHKDPGRIPRRKSPDYCLMSRPQVDVDLDSLYLLQFSCDQVSSVATRFLATSLISGRDLNFGCDLFGSVILKS